MGLVREARGGEGKAGIGSRRRRIRAGNIHSLLGIIKSHCD